MLILESKWSQSRIRFFNIWSLNYEQWNLTRIKMVHINSHLIGTKLRIIRTTLKLYRCYLWTDHIWNFEEDIILFIQSNYLIDKRKRKLVVFNWTPYWSYLKIKIVTEWPEIRTLIKFEIQTLSYKQCIKAPKLNSSLSISF